jgi:hypothetical protein
MTNRRVKCPLMTQSGRPRTSQVLRKSPGQGYPTQACYLLAVGLCLSSSATERKRLHAIAHTCGLVVWWFWPRRHHLFVLDPRRMLRGFV